MDNLEILKVIKSAGVSGLYHANSVATSRTFLTHSGLLSRGYVERQKLHQTPQDSDALDRTFGIWNDVFLDTVDIHYRARNQNHYGPVLFVLNVDSVLKDKTLAGTLRITRKNPVHWVVNQTEHDRYFDTEDEFRKEFSFGDFGKHFTFRTSTGDDSVCKPP